MEFLLLATLVSIIVVGTLLYFKLEKINTKLEEKTHSNSYQGLKDSVWKGDIKSRIRFVGDQLTSISNTMKIFMYKDKYNEFVAYIRQQPKTKAEFERLKEDIALGTGVFGDLRIYEFATDEQRKECLELLTAYETINGVI